MKPRTTVMMLPCRLPSLNDLKGRWALTNARKRFERQLRPLPLSRRLALVQPNGHALPSPRAVRCGMQITRYYGPRERPRDRDNLHGGAKPLRDALVRSGYLAGDSPEWLEEALVIETRSATGKPSIVIAIWPLK